MSIVIRRLLEALASSGALRAELVAVEECGARSGSVPTVRAAGPGEPWWHPRSQSPTSSARLRCSSRATPGYYGTRGFSAAGLLAGARRSLDD